MGWADCGDDSKGRPIGYAFESLCDYPGCNAKIDRGLAYACGGVHGVESHSCEGYFCPKHLTIEEVDGKAVQLCLECAKRLLSEDDPALLATMGKPRKVDAA